MARIETRVCVVPPHQVFPLDMLRYDMCWPSRQEDVVSIQESVRPGGAVGVREIMVEGAHGFCRARWASFGCDLR